MYIYLLTLELVKYQYSYVQCIYTLPNKQKVLVSSHHLIKRGG